MATNKKILILGDGRVKEALTYYLKKNKIASEVNSISEDSGKKEWEEKIKKHDILIGTLPGDRGEESLKAALEHKKDLIDIADVEPEFYKEREEKIKDAGIRVIPGCGFSPGITNFILGNEISKKQADDSSSGDIRDIEVKVGSLSNKKFFFPFLWCFEDLFLEHQYPSYQIIKGHKTKSPSFGDYQEESFFGIEAETYFGQGELELLLNNLSVKNPRSVKFRLIRPVGFFYFFKFLENHGFLYKNNLPVLKKILGSKKEDNFTIGEINISTEQENICWKTKVFSTKKEKLNSMQKYTGSFGAEICRLLIEKASKKLFSKEKEGKLLFPEGIAKDNKIFEAIISNLKSEGIEFKR